MKYSIVGPLAALALLVSPLATAVQFHTMQIDDWIDFWPGFNQVYEFNTNDDVTFDPALATLGSNATQGPLNPTGSTGSYHFSNPADFPGLSEDALLMGYYNGVITMGGDLHFGTNTITSLSTSLDQNLFDPTGNLADIDDPLDPSGPILLNDTTSNPDLELLPGFAQTMTITDNSFVTDYFYRPIDESAAWRTVNGGAYLLAGQDPGLIFAGDPVLIGLMNYFAAELSANPATAGWTFLGIEQASFFAVNPTTGAALSGPTGLGSQAFYSLDPGAAVVPVPAALPMLLSALITLAGVGARRRRGR